MRLIFDRGELKLIRAHVAALVVPARAPTIPDTYDGIEVGELKDWSSGAVTLLLEEGRLHLSAMNSRFEAIRDRSQYVMGVSIAAIGLLSARLDYIIVGVWAFLVWALAITLLLIALVIGFATFAATAELGHVDLVLLSRQPARRDIETARSLARAYTEGVKRSTNVVNVRFTLYRDSIWFLVFGVAVGTLAFGLASFGR